jgi:hypothetical protein
MAEFIYDGTPEALRRVFELSRQGVAVLCPRCRAKLIVALDRESANLHKVHTGIYCPIDPKHVAELIEIRPREHTS